MGRSFTSSRAAFEQPNQTATSASRNRIVFFGLVYAMSLWP